MKENVNLNYNSDKLFYINSNYVLWYVKIKHNFQQLTLRPWTNIKLS